MRSRPSLLAAATVGGMALGYLAYPLLHQPPAMSATVGSCNSPGAVARSFSSCEFSSAQLDHVADQLAPKVVERLGMSGSLVLGADSKASTLQLQANEKNKTAQAQVFTQATQLVDQMIASHRVTPEGLGNAQKLLQQTGQSNRGHELMARVSAAINKGELTPEQAGLLPPRMHR